LFRNLRGESRTRSGGDDQRVKSEGPRHGCGAERCSIVGAIPAGSSRSKSACVLYQIASRSPRLARGPLDAHEHKSPAPRPRSTRRAALSSFTDRRGSPHRQARRFPGERTA
jgi:hypothetical protein